jgi:septum site-determining protein MinC
MAAVPNTSATALFELKGAALTLAALVLRNTDLAALAEALDAQTIDAPGLFDRDPVAIDLAQVQDATEAIDFMQLCSLLRRHKMVPVAVKGGTAAQMAAAFEAGLVQAHDQAPLSPRPRAVAEPPPVPVPVPVPAMIVSRPLRSGQQVVARGGDLVVLAVVSYGAEVIADGSIHVYAPLRGRAVAGARGDTRARIFSTCMEPQLIAIAGTYRTIDTDLPADVRGKAAQARLDGEQLVLEALKS